MSQIHTGSSRILQKIWVMSLALSSATNTDCLLSSGRFHYIVAVVLGRHPIVLCSHNTGPSPIFYPRSSSWVQTIVFLHDHFNSEHLAATLVSAFSVAFLFSHSSPWYLYNFKTNSTTWEIPTLPSYFSSTKYRLATSGAQLLCADSEETIPRDFTLMMLVSP